jgi:enoyl reductase
MRAVRYDRYGPPEVLYVTEVDDPVAAPGELLVELRAVGLNPADYKVRRGATPVTPLPAGIGREFSGVVIAAADGAGEFRVGDEVIGTGEWALGERFALPHTMVARKPDGLGWDVAATLPVAVQTAYLAVESQRLTPADTVLVSAAAGGVGYPAAQFARRTGATVLGTASPGNAELLRAIGVVPIPYGPGLSDRLRAAAPKITAVLDHHGVETIETALELGVPRERINTISGYAERYAVQAVGRRGMNRPVVERIASEILAGELDIRIEAAYPLDRVVEAYRRLESGHLSGKVVVTLP